MGSKDQLSVSRDLPHCDFGPRGKSPGQQEFISGLFPLLQKDKGTLSDEGLTLWVAGNTWGETSKTRAARRDY